MLSLLLELLSARLYTALLPAGNPLLAALRRLFHVFAADDAASSVTGSERTTISPADVREALASTGGGYCWAADSKEGECKKEGFDAGACPTRCCVL